MAPSKTLCFYNNKGGVGKTTLAYNYAIELAMRQPHKKILMVDMDCQINTTCFCLGGGTRGRDRAYAANINHESIKDLLLYFHEIAGGDYPSPDAIAKVLSFAKHVQTIRQGDVDRFNEPHNEPFPCPPNLYIIPGATDIDISCELLEQSVFQIANRFNPAPAWKAFSILRRIFQNFGEEYIVVADCNPSFSFSTRIALIACNELIIPTTFDEFATGGVQNLLTQLGAYPTSPEISTFRSYLQSLTLTQHQQLEALGRTAPVGYTFPLPLAKIRTVVINRYPNRAKAAKPVLMMVSNVINLLARAYRHRRELFADINTIEGTKQPPPLVQTELEARKIIQMHYFHKIIELGSGVLVSANLGVGITMLNEKRYYLQVPSYRTEIEEEEADNNNEEVDVADDATLDLPPEDQIRDEDQKVEENFIGMVREDCVKYGLLIQDLVELTLHSSKDPQFLLHGRLTRTQLDNTINGAFAGEQNDCIVCPMAIPQEFRVADAAEGPISAEQRLGRRILPLECIELNSYYNQWRPGTVVRRRNARRNVRAAAIGDANGAPRQRRARNN